MGDEIPGPFNRFRDKNFQANGHYIKDHTHRAKRDLNVAGCPHCGNEIEYTSVDTWRETLKCNDCGVRFRAE